MCRPAARHPTDQLRPVVIQQVVDPLDRIVTIRQRQKPQGGSALNRQRVNFRRRLGADGQGEICVPLWVQFNYETIFWKSG